nr:putative reverse transcriptase domain, ribonuclease H-like domain, aspartic peptidase domain protein [Tanacetum cinerariifolium]
METVFCISNCTMENQIKFATCTLLRSALTWWNSHVMTVGPDVAYAMTWINLRKKMTNKYCPMCKIKTLEVELRNLMVKGIDVVTYNQRDLMVKGTDVRALKCYKCNRVGHLACDCRSDASTNTTNNQRGTGPCQKPACFECGAQVHFKSECPKLKNNNQGNLAGNGNAPTKVYMVGHAWTNPGSNVVMVVFMDLMNRVCKPYLDKFMIFFIDDILIYLKNNEEHEEHLKLILELLKK